MKQFRIFTLFLALLGAFWQTDAQNIAANKAAMTATFTAFNANNFDQLDKFMDRDLVDHALPPGQPNGLEGTKAFFKMIKSAFPDGNIQVLDLIAEGNYVAMHSEFTGTQKGEF